MTRFEEEYQAYLWSYILFYILFVMTLLLQDEDGARCLIFSVEPSEAASSWALNMTPGTWHRGL